MAATDATPVTVIGGYLGSGKTTLVNHLLRNAGGRKLAVLVNDFGALPIDADLIETERDDIISIAGGCVCCSYGNDLLAALDELSRNRPEITDVLVESSGVALPSSIASSISLLQRYRVNAVVVLFDAATAMEFFKDRYLADTIRAQVLGADLILLNKTDLVDTGRQEEAARLLAGLTDAAPILPTREGRVPPAAVLEMNTTPRARCPALVDHDTATYMATYVCLPDGTRAAELACALADATLGLIRAKGVMRTRSGEVVQLHVVGRRWSVSPCRGGSVNPGHLVTISLRAEADQQQIEGLVARYVDQSR